MQIELKLDKDECKRLLRCSHCVVNNYPEEYRPPVFLPILPDYAKNLIEKWKMVRKRISPLSTKMILKTRYPLLCAEPNTSADDKIKICSKHWQMARKRSDEKSRS